MTDLEITRLCAEAMGYSKWSAHHGELPSFTKETGVYDPLHDDAQAMALVKRFNLSISNIGDGFWTVVHPESTGDLNSSGLDLNRAICACVAKMKAAK